LCSSLAVFCERWWWWWALTFFSAAAAIVLGCRGVFFFLSGGWLAWICGIVVRKILSAVLDNVVVVVLMIRG
jgi:hypothetical protein